MTGLILLIGILFLNALNMEKSNAVIHGDAPHIVNKNNEVEAQQQQEQEPEVSDAKDRNHKNIKLYNKKAAYLLAELLVKVTLLPDFIEKTGQANGLNLFQIIANHSELHKEMLEQLNIDSFFDFLSEANVGQEWWNNYRRHIIYEILEEKPYTKYVFGLENAVGINMEIELNKLCEHYKESAGTNNALEAYNEICRLAAKIVNRQFQGVENKWNYRCNDIIDKKFRQHQQEGQPTEHELNNAITELRKTETSVQAKELYKQIWIKALNFTLMSLDVCYYPARLKIWKNKKLTQKLTNLDKYRDGMSIAEYLAYFLLNMIRQIDPEFELSNNDEPYVAVRCSGVLVKDATLPKLKKSMLLGLGRTYWCRNLDKKYQNCKKFD